MLNSPVGISIDLEMNILYIADTGSHIIREVDLNTGIINTAAGTPGTAGYAANDINAAAALFDGPGGVMHLWEEEVMVMDTGNDTISIVEYDWQQGFDAVHWLIGNGVGGYYGDGMSMDMGKVRSPSSALWGYPGNILIADTGNRAIRELEVFKSQMDAYAIVEGTGIGNITSTNNGMFCEGEFEDWVLSMGRDLVVMTGMDTEHDGSFTRRNKFLTMVRSGTGYSNADLSGDWYLRSLTVPKNGSGSQNFGISHCDASFNGVDYTSGDCVDGDGTSEPFTGNYSVDSGGLVNVSMVNTAAGENYDAVLAENRNWIVASYIDNSSIGLDLWLKRAPSYDQSDLQGRWAFKQIWVPQGGQPDNYSVDSGELYVWPDGTMEGHAYGRHGYDLFNGTMAVNSVGGVLVDGDSSDNLVLDASKTFMVGVRKDDGEMAYTMIILVRMSQIYDYATSHMTGGWWLRGLETQQDGHPDAFHPPRCDLTMQPSGILNGTCYDPDGTPEIIGDGPVFKVDKDGTWFEDEQGGDGCWTDFDYGENVTFNANPAPGSSFVGWFGNVCSGTGTCVVDPVTQDMVVVALFNSSTLNHYITATAGPNGAISPYGSISVQDGGSQTFYMEPDAGYQVSDVVVDSISQGEIYDYTFSDVTSGHSIDVSFVLTNTVAVPVNSLDTAGYGFGYGTNGHYAFLETQFSNNGSDRLFQAKGWDIDYKDEVSVYLNDQFLGYLTNTGDAQLGFESLWVLPASEQLPGLNSVKFVQNFPGETWGVTNLGVFSFGRHWGLVSSSNNGVDGFELHFQGGASRLLEFSMWDSDYDGEITFTLNGKPWGMPAGPNLAWSTWYQLILPGEWLYGGDNMLFMKGENNIYAWGVKLNRFGFGTEALGYFGADTTTMNGLAYMVPVFGKSDMPFELEFYDITAVGEADLYANGSYVGNVPTTSPASWGGNYTFNLAPDQLALIDVAYNDVPSGVQHWGVAFVNAPDSDGDGAADYMDLYPSDPNEWNDTDGDGIGDNADTDADGDGMPDSFENANGFDPYNPADGQGDTDGDGLANFLEYFYGSSFTNTNSDGDALPDGIDSHPNDPSNTGAVINSGITVPIGWNYGSGLHFSEVGINFNYTLSNDKRGLLLYVQAYDVDVVDELELYLNGQNMGYFVIGLNNSPNVEELWWLPSQMLIEGENRLSIRQTSSPDTWGIDKLSLHEFETFWGYYAPAKGGANGFVLHFLNNLPDDRLVAFKAFDSDFDGEISFKLNGGDYAVAPAGPNLSFTPSYHLYIPYGAMNQGDNRLEVLPFNPAYAWAVSLDSISNQYREYGYLNGESTSPTDADYVNFLVPVPAGNDMPFSVEFFDIVNAADSSNITLYVDETPYGNPGITGEGNWGGTIYPVLQADSQHLVEIDQLLTPGMDTWGVRLVEPMDSDSDGVPDYMDVEPFNPGEQYDADNDGQGDNADPDDDNDGMPDTYEDSEAGLNPNNPNDAQADTDGDGLINFFEYLYGTDWWGNTDSDGDGALDGFDSDPSDPVNNGAVINVPENAQNTGQYGWNYGGSMHNSVVGINLYNDDAGPGKLLYLQGYDIDSDSEVEVYLNNTSLGTISVGVNNAIGGAELFWLPDHFMVNGMNRVELVQTTPGETWGVTNIGLYNFGAWWGKYKGISVTGDLKLHFQGGESRLFGFKAYDVDFDNEVSFELNGNVYGGVPVGPNLGDTERYHLFMSQGILNSGDNVLRVIPSNPNYTWGIRTEGMFHEKFEYGYFGGPVDLDADYVNFMVPVGPGPVPFWLQFYDIINGTEVDVLLDGAFDGDVAFTGAGNWGSLYTMDLPPNGVRIVKADNLLTPGTDTWGVRLTGMEDSDGDGVQDYVDAFPADPAEWDDSDGDGIGSNADTDDDGDGMPDTYENANGLDPYSYADSNDDSDGDGLVNFYEYFFGTSLSLTDSDADGSLDGEDSAPGSAINNGLAVQIPMGGMLDPTQYGNGYGGSFHYSAVTLTFDSDGKDKLLHLQGLDIDTPAEINLSLNGKDLGNISVFVNGTGPDAVWFIPKDVQREGTNRLEIVSSTPGDTWGVTRLGLLDFGSTFGLMYSAGDSAHPNGIEMHFQGDDSYLLEMAGYDNDSTDEITFELNGKPYGGLPEVLNNGWTSWYQMYFPMEFLQNGDNVFKVIPKNPAYKWGIKLNDMRWVTEDLGDFGPGTTQEGAAYLVPVGPLGGGTMPFELEFYDIESIGEVNITVDGGPITNAPVTGDLTWAGNTTYDLPEEHMSVIDIYRTGADMWGVSIIKPLDTDSDGVPDYLDAFPSDPAEWQDTDWDGIPDSADSDDDDDGMPDTYEDSYAFLDPKDKDDAWLDYDGDGLENMIEYYIGSDPTLTDSDGDSIIDGLDSGPGSALDNGTVIDLTVGSVDSTDHGWGYGDNAYYSTLIVRFTSDGQDKLLQVEGYDIVNGAEVMVKFNGETAGYLAGDNAAAYGGDEMFFLPGDNMSPIGENCFVEFIQAAPGDTWAVRRLAVYDMGTIFGGAMYGAGR
jgi:hypothetical protein